MKIEWSRTFSKEFHKLHAGLQKRFEEKFRLFIQNPRHPSLGVKKMAGTDNIWEARLTENYRWTFEPIEEGIKLRHIGTHKILRRP